MQVKGIKSPNHYEKFLDAQISLTEQIILPNNEEFYALKDHRSEQLSNRHNQSNLRLAIYNQLMREQQLDERKQKIMSFNRETFSVLSKKQRIIRRQNYCHSSNKPFPKQDIPQTHDLQIKEATIVRAQSAQPRRSMSSHSQRPLRGFSSRQYSEKALNRPQTSTSSQNSASKLSKMKIVQNTQKYFQFRKQNPLVIYPFQSHLKIKRIDQNPKILANMITKKHKFMNREELYEYVNRIMNKRPK